MPLQEEAYTVTVNSFFLDMFNAQYMFAVCFALLDYREKTCFMLFNWQTNTSLGGIHWPG